MKSTFTEIKDILWRISETIFNTFNQFLYFLYNGHVARSFPLLIKGKSNKTETKQTKIKNQQEIIAILRTDNQQNLKFNWEIIAVLRTDN